MQSAKSLGMSLDSNTSEVKARTHSTDAFLGGALSLSQPTKGFRAGTDSVLLGAATAPDSTLIADLGAGAGAAALTALYWRSQAHALLVENEPEAADLARRNIDANGLAERARIAQCDLYAKGPDRHTAGLVSDHFTSVIANPPYFERGTGTAAPEGARAMARHMPKQALEHWVRVATGIAAPGGEVIFVHRASALPELLAAFAARLGAIKVLPLAPRPGQPAKTVLVRGRKGSRAPLTLLAPLVLHPPAGHEFTPALRDILMGRCALNWERQQG